MDKDTLADIITSRPNTDMKRKRILLEILLKYFYEKVKAKMYFALTHDIKEIEKIMLNESKFKIH
jgi:hypothetical protein